jgi:NTE family protein
MNRQLAFVLGGGGARGALQVGALQALLEAGFRPDLLVGTSAGAVNAAFLALHGFTRNSLKQLVSAWRDASNADLLPANYLWLTARALLGRPLADPAQHMRDFFIAHGLAPGLCFADIQTTHLILVAADMNTGQPILYGQDHSDNLLEGVLASTALPPWMAPIRKDGRLLVDGGAVSNLPVEPALVAGATEIIALDLADPRDVPTGDHGFGPFLGKLIYTVEQRQQDLELALAAAQGVPVTLLHLQGSDPVALWDFQHADALIAQGYQVARQEVEKQPSRAW